MKYFLEDLKINQARIVFNNVFSEAWKSRKLHLIRYLFHFFKFQQELKFHTLVEVYTDQNDFEMIKYLFDNRYINVKSVTPDILLLFLKKICKAGDSKTMEAMCHEFDHILSSSEELLTSLLIPACESKTFAVIKIIIGHITELKITYKCNELLYMVFTKWYDSKLDVIAYLIEQGICDLKSPIDEEKNTLLHHACAVGNKEIVQFILEHSTVSVLIQQNIHDSIPLQQSIQNNHLNVIEYILTYDDCSDQLKHLTPNNFFLILHLAYKNGSNEFLKHVIKTKLISHDVKDEKGNTIWHEICKKCDIIMLKYLAKESQTSLKLRDNNGNTPIHEVCRNPNITNEMIQYILSLDLSYFCSNNKGFTPLHTAVDNKCYFLAFCLMKKLKPLNDDLLLHLLFETKHSESEFLKIVLKQTANVLPDSINQSGKTVFQKACTNGDIDSVKFFIEQKNFDPQQVPAIIYETIIAQQIDVLMYFAQSAKFKPTFIDILHEDQKLVTIMFDKFPLKRTYELLYELNSTILIDYENNTLLHLACSAGEYEMVQTLISTSGLNPLEPNLNNNTPLANACSNGHINIVKHIVNHCETKDKNYKSDTSLLFIACKSRNTELLQFLVAKSSNFIKDMKNSEGNSLLHVACENKDFLMVQHLESLGCNPKERNEKGFTPLEIACTKRSVEIVRFLVGLENCKDILASSRTVVHCSFDQYADEDILIDLYKILLKAGCDLTKTDENQNSLLHKSSKRSQKLILFLIYKCGCDPLRMNSEGKNFFTLIFESYKHEIATCVLNKHIFTKIPEDQSLLFDVYDKMTTEDTIKLIKKGFNPKVKDRNGDTLLHKACMKEDFPMVRCLIENFKCDDLILWTQHKIQTRSPLEIAMNCRSSDIFEYLLKLCKCSDPIALLSKPKVLVSFDVLRVLILKFKCIPRDVIDFDGKTLLHKACQDCKNIDLVTFLIEKCGLEPLARDWNGSTTLEYAIEGAKGQTQSCRIVKYLIEKHGCDTICQSSAGLKLLLMACKDGQGVNMSLIEILIRGGCSMDVPFCITHAICSDNNLDFLKFLVTDRRYLLSQTSNEGLNPINVALKSQHCLPIVKYLLRNFTDEFRKTCTKPLLNSAYGNQSFHTIILLIEEGECDPKSEDSDGINLLHLACTAGDLFMAEYLIEEKDCDPKHEDHEGLNCLNKACYSGSPILVKYLIEDCGMSKVKYCEPPLHSVVKKKQYHLMRILLEKGFKILAEDGDGNCLLHWACKAGDIQLLYILKNVFMNSLLSKNCNGKTPFHFACEHKNSDIIRFLIINYNLRHQDALTDIVHSAYFHESSDRIYILKLLVSKAGYDINSKNSHGNTMLHLAASHGDFRMCQFLCEELNCELTVENNKKLTPFHYACNSFQLRAIKYLAKIYKDGNMESIVKTALCNLQLQTATVEVLDYLIVALKCDQYSVNEEDLTLLHRACLANNSDVVQYLLVHYEFNCFALSQNEATPLHISCEKKSLKITSILLDHCIFVEKCNNKHVLSYLIDKCYSQVTKSECDTGILEILLKKGYSGMDDENDKLRKLLEKTLKDEKFHLTKKLISTWTIENNECTYFLYFCCQQNIHRSLRFLIIECGCDPSQAQWSGQDLNPLISACNEGDEGLLRYLNEECGCKQLFTTFGEVLLQTAFKNHYDMIIKYLLRKCHLDEHHEIITVMKCYTGKRFQLLELLCSDSDDEPMYDESLGQTLLHNACSTSDIEMVKFLIEKCNCNTSKEDTKGKVPLFYAKDTDVIEYLVIKCKVNLSYVDNDGNTSLHLICSQKVVCVPAFEYILSTGEVDPLQLNENNETAIQVLQDKHFRGRYQELVKQLMKFKVSNPVDMYVNILILGHPGAGKSTLACAIIKKAKGVCIPFTENEVIKNTAGIIPSILNDDKHLKNIILHDFAGHVQYHSSHLSVIDHLIENSSAVIILVLNLTDAKKIDQLHYWLTLIDAKRKCMKTQTRLIIVASHCDKLPEEKIRGDIARLKGQLDLRGFTSDCYFIIPHDCRGSLHEETDFISAVSESCQQIRDSPCFKVGLFSYTLYSFIEHLKSNNAGKNVYELKVLIAKMQEHPEYHVCLPKSSEEYVKAFKTLDSIGLIIFLQDIKKQGDSWVILDKGLLLTQINGILFLTEEMDNPYFKKYHELTSNAGIVASSTLEELCKRLDLQKHMVIKFLLLMGLCQEVPQGFFDFANLKTEEISDKVKGPFLFFPSLNAMKECPIVNRKFNFGWILQCPRYEFFLSDFMHSLILNFLTTYVTVNLAFSEKSIFPDIYRQCNIWRSGISWYEPTNYKQELHVLVEFTDNGRSLVLLMSGSTKGMKEKCADIISKILLMTATNEKTEYYTEFLIDPDELVYPLKDLNEHKIYDLRTITLYVLKKIQIVPNYASTDAKSVLDLLAFEDRDTVFKNTKKLAIYCGRDPEVS